MKAMATTMCMNLADKVVDAIISLPPTGRVVRGNFRGGDAQCGAAARALPSTFETRGVAC